MMHNACNIAAAHPTILFVITEISCLLLNGFSNLSTALQVLSIVVFGGTQVDTIVQFCRLQRLHTDTHTCTHT